MIDKPRASSWSPVLTVGLVAGSLYAGALPVTAQADEPEVIASMDTLRFQSPSKGTTRLVAGRTGQAQEFHFDKGSSGVFATSNIHGTPEWDHAAGFSFWVKGDGMDQLGGLEFIFDEDYSVRYDLVFLVEGTDWREVTVAWSDLVPVLPGPKARPLGGAGGNAPSKLSGLWFGRWWYWGDYPALTFAVDDIRLEPSIDRERTDYRPAGDPLARVRAELKNGEKITIVTMGDSLTDKRHWANRQTAWVDLLGEALGSRHHVAAAIVNPAIGGTQLRQNVILIRRWSLRTPEPDLVTIFFGGNDWDAGMRGEEFERACEDAVDRVRRATRGKADVLLMTTNPTATRWTETGELAAACRRAAKDRNCGLADTERAFHAAGQSDQNRLYVDDRVHLSRAGHQVVADTVLKAITGTE
jgi:lysophospholipase L1-like esterase